MAQQWLCRVCRNLTLERIVVKDRKSEGKARWQPFQSTFRLRAAVGSGCAFCTILLEGIQNRLLPDAIAAFWEQEAQIGLSVGKLEVPFIEFDVDHPRKLSTTWAKGSRYGTGLWCYATHGMSMKLLS
jgi:hypothetical protein